MARNTQKKLYITVGITRGSSAHRALMSDVEQSGETVSTVVAMRLADYYAGHCQPASSPLLVPDTSIEKKQVKTNAVEAASEWA